MTRPRLLAAALEAEWLKFRSAPVPWVATAVLMLGIVTLYSSFILVAGQSDSLMAAKLDALVAGAGWTALVSLARMFGIGLALGFGAPTSAEAGTMARLCAIAPLTAGLALPCAIVAAIARGYLAPIGAVIAHVAIAQIVVVVGAVGWFPWAAPGLWAGLSGAEATSRVRMVQLLLVVPVAAASVQPTTRAWARLQL